MIQHTKTDTDCYPNVLSFQLQLSAHRTNSTHGGAHPLLLFPHSPSLLTTSILRQQHQTRTPRSVFFRTPSSNGFQNRNFHDVWALETLLLSLWVLQNCDKIHFFSNESGKLACLSLKRDKGVPHFVDTFDGSSKIPSLLHCSKCKVWWWVTAFLQLCALNLLIYVFVIVSFYYKCVSTQHTVH